MEPSEFDIAEWASDAARFIGGLPEEVAGRIGASVALRVVDARQQPTPDADATDSEGFIVEP